MSVKCEECRWRRRVENQSGAGEDACGTAHHEHVRQEGGSVEAPYQTGRGCVSSFADLCFVETENGLPLEVVTYRLLKKSLVKKVIPWIHNRLVWTTQERYWPITLPQFREVNAFLADHLPRVHKDDERAAIAYFLKLSRRNGGTNTCGWKRWRGKPWRP